ncbi:MAG: hypothetical protein ACI9PY_000265 [Ascidiaceihabitans sp.]|jgi:hypothetical protein
MPMISRSFIAIGLAFVLALTGQSMAAARGAAPVVGQMVLCTGTGSVLVYTDENGAPTAAAHICPDCVMSLMAAQSRDPVSFDAHLSQWQGPKLNARVVHAQLRIASYLSRAPPA